VRFGAFSLFLPALLSEAALDFSRAFAAVDPEPRSDRALAARGLRVVGEHLVPALELESLDTILRELPAKDGGSVLPLHAAETLGWSPAQLTDVLRGLGFTPARKPVAGEPSVWRRRHSPKTPAPSKAVSHTPFAALAALTRPTERRTRKSRRRKPRVAAT
jgi:ATP-dependent RNA helicase SUPV3L1/SUV3